MDARAGSPLHRTASISRRDFLAVAGLAATCACGGSSVTPSTTPSARLRLQAGRSAARLIAGEHPLGLSSGRDGLIYVPQSYDPERPTPVALMLHGAGGDASGMGFTRGVAEAAGVIVVIPESRRQTWDVILGGFGPDVEFINQAVNEVFSRANVDTGHVGIGGFSDGASYALSLGVANGDLFTHLIAFSPGFVARTERQGKPRVFVSHGDSDEVLPIERTSRRIVPDLRAEGYDVTYREFAGPHTVPGSIAREAFGWFLE